MKQKFEHRGRIQAQGENLEESESWAQSIAPTKSDGLQMVDDLRNKIPLFQEQIRQKQFEDVKRFIHNTPQKGVIAPVSKTYLVKNTDHERVDLEVIKGIAFIDDKKQNK